ncbi:MAG: two-component regulator propeller domain-containing protein, partial [Bacteroidota bacterium]
MDRSTERFKNYQFESFGLRNNLSRAIPSRVGNLVKARNGDIWMGTFSDGIFRYLPEQDNFINYRFPFQKVTAHFPAPDNIDHIISLQQDRFDDQVFWAGTTAGLLKINSSSHEVSWFLYPENEETDFLHQNAIRHIYQHVNGNLYLSSWYAGVNIFNPETAQFYVLPLESENSPFYSDAKKLLRTPVRGVFFKSEGELWISTLDGLITYSTYQESCTRIQFNKEDENATFGLSFIDRQGRSWLGTSRELHLFDPIEQQFRVYDYADLNPDKRGFSFHILHPVPNGDFAILPQAADGTYSVKLSSGQWNKSTIPLAFQQDPIGFLPRSFSKAPDQSWTIATPDHLYSLGEDLEQITQFDLPDSISSYNFRCLSWDQEGQLWVGTQNNGLLKWDNNKKEWTAFDQEIYGTESPSSISHLLVDQRGNVWIERSGGYSVFVAALGRFLHFIEEDNPIAAGMHGFTEDKSGRVWINGINGILAYGLSNQPEIGIQGSYDLLTDHQIRSYTSLQSDEQGFLWALAESKLMRISPDSINQLELYDLTYGIQDIDDLFSLNILPDGHIVIGGRNKVWVGHRGRLRKNEEIPISLFSSKC